MIKERDLIFKTYPGKDRTHFVAEYRIGQQVSISNEILDPDIYREVISELKKNTTHGIRQTMYGEMYRELLDLERYISAKTGNYDTSIVDRISLLIAKIEGRR